MSEEEISFKEKIQTINFGAPAKPKVKVDRGADVKHVQVMNEDTGKTGGYQSYHGDGRVDATVTPETVVSSLLPNGE